MSLPDRVRMGEQDTQSARRWGEKLDQPLELVPLPMPSDRRSSRAFIISQLLFIYGEAAGPGPALALSRLP